MKRSFENKLISIILMFSLLVMPMSVSAVEVTDDESNAVSKAEVSLDSKVKGGPKEEEVSGTQETEGLHQAVEGQIKELGNDYPIVLVHGFFGWGNDEVIGKNYWGWDSSIRDMLNSEGFKVYTPTVGPISSNWDRACELYAYLVGGTVDYGQAHAEKYGHSRYGRSYPGVLKDLGSIDENGNVKKIHLIGHSMGGDTIRVLSQLLENGYPEETAKSGENASSLFKGGRHWVESITTISTPNDGTQLADYTNNNLQPFFNRFMNALAAGEGGLDPKDVIYDFKMEQWGLKKNPGESQESYVKRVFSSKVWDKENKDLGLWDISLEGQSKINSFAGALSDVYYFTISCTDTHKSLLSNHQLPNLNMDPLLRSSALMMGRYTENRPGKIPVDSSWFEGDGFVCKRSAMGPRLGSTDKIVDFNGTPQIGVWNYLGNINNVDHLEVIFLRQPWDKEYLKNEYRTWAKMLSQL